MRLRTRLKTQSILSVLLLIKNEERVTRKREVYNLNATSKIYVKKYKLDNFFYQICSCPLYIFWEYREPITKNSKKPFHWGDFNPKLDDWPYTHIIEDG